MIFLRCPTTHNCHCCRGVCHACGFFNPGRHTLIVYTDTVRLQTPTLQGSISEHAVCILPTRLHFKFCSHASPDRCFQLFSCFGIPHVQLARCFAAGFIQPGINRNGHIIGVYEVEIQHVLAIRLKTVAR
jgi:hypothetical protein